MISKDDLKKMAQAKLRDAKLLYQSKRYDGAAYLCGYAIELALKARICTTLRWPGFPESRKEFENLQSFRTHDLDALLHLSGIQSRVQASYLTEWSVVHKWNPEDRYRVVGSTSRDDAQKMIDAVVIMLGVL